MRKGIILFILFFCCNLVACSSEENISKTDKVTEVESKVEEAESRVEETESKIEETESESSTTDIEPKIKEKSESSTTDLGTVSVETNEFETNENVNNNSNELTGFCGGIVNYSTKVDLDQYSDVVELVLVDDAESINADFVFTADYTLKDLKIYTLAFAGTEGMKFIIKDTLYENPAFGVNSAIHISTYFWELYPNLAVSYIDETGSEVYYYFIVSMKDGEIILNRAESILIL